MVLNVAIFSWGAGNQQYGLGEDARIMETVLRELSSTGKIGRVNIVHKDPYAFIGKGALPVVADVHIYLEVPCRVAFPWARVNIVVPNAEWWYTDAWSWVQDTGAVFWFRTRHCQRLFETKGVKGRYIGWRCPNVVGRCDGADSALYVVGGSKHKLAAAGVVVSAWKPEWPTLTILCASEGPADLVPNVIWRSEYVSDQEKRRLQEGSLYHVVASQAEGFGYTMAEAINHNALILRTDLPVYEEFWGGLLGSAGLIKTNDGAAGTMLDMPRTFSAEAVVKGMTSLLGSKKRDYREAVMKLTKSFRSAVGDAWQIVERSLPKAVVWTPPGPPKDLPVIGVITLVHNRPQWFSHAVRNIETAEYPRDRLIWVIVDDGTGVGRVDMQIEKVRMGLPDLQIQYVSLNKKTPIGQKRNLGCVAAAARRQDLSVFTFMDDDDHYPKASLALRIAWLQASGKDCVYASTLPMYDITRYISAVNVPPLNIAPCERISEATLCFKRSFWERRRFPQEISVAEGEEFIRGRDQETVEIPPEGIIVSFLHGRNFTSRRVPEQKEANGCHYGFSDEYFMMISQLAGLTV